MAYPPALSNGSPDSMYASISVSEYSRISTSLPVTDDAANAVARNRDAGNDAVGTSSKRRQHRARLGFVFRLAENLDRPGQPTYRPLSRVPPNARWPTRRRPCPPLCSPRTPLACSPRLAGRSSIPDGTISTVASSAPMISRLRCDPDARMMYGSETMRLL